MKRIFTYEIQPEDAGTSIRTFLKNKNFSRSAIVLLKKTENGIMVDSNRCYVNCILNEGEILTLSLIENENAETDGQEKIIPNPLPLSIAYEDEDLLVINKSAGMPTHPSLRHYTDTLANAVMFYAKERGEYYPFRCINRLDRDTSGLTIIAKNLYSSCILYEDMKKRRIKRTYYAITDGILPACGTVDAPIARKEESVIARTVDFTRGERAVTHFERLAVNGGLSLAKLTPETGRTHQLRVHMRYLGFPLIGDFLYHPAYDFYLGGDAMRIERQALHAGTLAFPHPVSGEPLLFRAPLPEDMRQFFPMVIP